MTRKLRGVTTRDKRPFWKKCVPIIHPSALSGQRSELFSAEKIGRGRHPSCCNHLPESHCKTATIEGTRSFLLESCSQKMSSTVFSSGTNGVSAKWGRGKGAYQARPVANRELFHCTE
ncbi:hypothetical protein IscW_ISCW007155 [Ixodes scapularis]|uniref:Uncharacterized protein n=1 Tax=Ixodes scapularis TaxID=6945 RepID=B7PTQ0_IXOSC|nr:hypothetical protein IscW_ISCW007155 [Ixodes scapularis]|eukprot:XP_002404758.1 hypothetical protein IscW_ISCW007155 [Ixodes scapularis]